jgi:Raf kinase inhibitor-like YbhB/YbcL family protein
MRNARSMFPFLILPLISIILILSKEGATMATFTITSPAFKTGDFIPAKFTCDGEDVNPSLVIGNVPPETKSLALIMDDPDAPSGMWVHWVLWNIDPKTTEISEDSVPAGAKLGVNDFRQTPYGGPCPPSGTHRYFFKLYALDAKLELSASTNKAALEKAMKGHILVKTELMGRYKRK